MPDGADTPDESPGRSTAALFAFQDALLPGTIANALQTSFYRDRWRGSDPSLVDRASLASLPAIDKEEIRAAGAAAQNRDGVICSEIFTTGTTGNPLITVRSDREQSFIHEFFAGQLAANPRGRYLRGLEFTNPYHGTLIRVPASIHYHRVSVYDAGSFEYGRKTLLQAHHDADVDTHCSVLAGLERCLRAFTLDTIAKYPDGFPPTGLRLVVSYSQYLTEAWRRRLEETWHAPVVDRFSVSEVFGGASRCLSCGWYHFEPFVIPEVIGAHSGEVLRTGSGLLALTALFPFQQAQPLIRYLTGDLVQVTHEESCRPGTTAIKPLGRARYGVPEPNSDDWLITAACVLEAVDELDDIKRIPRFSGVDQIADPCAIGHPKYRTRWSEGAAGVEIRIELALKESVTKQRCTEICSAVLGRIKEGSPRLRGALRAGRAAIVVVSCEDVEADLIAQAHSGGVWSQA